MGAWPPKPTVSVGGGCGGKKGGEGKMERLSQMTAAPLHLMDKFRQELLTILDERRVPIQEQQNRINQLREQIRQEGEGHLDAFERESQEMEKDLLQKMEQLKEMRHRASLIRRVFSTMFRTG